MTTDIPSTPIGRQEKAPNPNKLNSFRLFLDEPQLGRTVYPTPSVLPEIPKTNVIGQPVQPGDSYSSFPPVTGTSARVLCGDVKIMMQPVCDVLTRGIDPDGGKWWLHRSSEQPEVTTTPPVTVDTTSRYDFQYRGCGIQGTTRYAANSNRKPAHGIIPANWLRRKDGCCRQRFLAEDISYEHEYNSRLDPNYPNRGQRQGNFVWRILPDGRVDQMLCRYGYGDGDVASSDINCRHKCPPKLPAFPDYKDDKQGDAAVSCFLRSTKCLP